MNNSLLNYVYILLDTRKPGVWNYKGVKFDYRPFYVGRGIGRRMLDHFNPSSYNEPTLKGRTIRKIMSVTGRPHIVIKAFDNLTYIESEDIEISIISHFGRIVNKTGFLTNITAGGRGKAAPRGEKSIEKYKQSISKSFGKNSRRINQLTLNGIFIKTWDSISQITNALKIDGGSISRCCNGVRSTCGGFKWEFEGTSAYIEKESPLSNAKPIYQYSNGCFVERHDNVTSALRSLGRFHGSTEIVNVCRGKLSSAFGFQWYYENYGPQISTGPFRKGKLIAQIDTNLNIVKIYSSIKEIKRETGFGVDYAIKQGTICQGYYWQEVHGC